MGWENWVSAAVAPSWCQSWAPIKPLSTCQPVCQSSHTLWCSLLVYLLCHFYMNKSSSPQWESSSGSISSELWWRLSASRPLSSQWTLAAPNLLRLVWENVGEWQLSPQQVYLSSIKILPLIKANLINAFSTCSITAPLQCSHTRALKEPPTREPKPPREQLNKVHLLACLRLSPALSRCHFVPLNIQSQPPHAVLSKLLKWEKIDGNFGKNFGHHITTAHFLVQLKMKMLICFNNLFYSTISY